MRLRTKLACSILALLAAITIHAAQKSDPAKVMLEAAKKKEVVDGDLNAAIQQYKAIADKFKNDRPVVADALIHMAECYQKLGDAESKKIYERIVREYPDQKSAVDLARTRLGGKINVPQTLAQRQLWTGPNMMYGAPSLDGRFLTQAGNGDLAIRDLTTGVAHQITNSRKGDPMQNPAYPTISKISPDGKRIAVAWNNSDGYQLRVINVDGSNEQTISRNPEVEWINPVDWALDGKQVLAKVRTRSQTGQIAWISVADKSARTLKTMPWSSLGRITLSPDGRYIAYDARSDNTSKKNTIFVIASDGSKETAITDGTAVEKVFGWMPDAKTLLFATDRRGSRELWAIRVLEGKPAGSPNLIQGDIDGTLEPLGITKSGSMYYWQVGVVGEVNVASVDWNTGAVSALKKVSEGLIPDVGADWSPDGRRFAFVAHRGTDLRKRFLAIRSLETGEARDIPQPDDLLILNTGGWSPDGNSFLVIANDGRLPRGVYIVDVKTGNFRQLDGVPADQVQWMPNGKSILYTRIEKKGGNLSVQHLFIRDLESTTEREVAYAPANTPLLALSFAISPNAQRLAFSPIVAPKSPPLNVMPLDGGPARRLLEGSGWIWAWTPDSGRIVFSGGKIVSVPAEGGEPQPLQIEIAAGRKLRSVGIHPNGRQILYNISGQEMGVWVMENLALAIERALGNK